MAKSDQGEEDVARVVRVSQSKTDVYVVPNKSLAAGHLQGRVNKEPIPLKLSTKKITLASRAAGKTNNPRPPSLPTVQWPWSSVEYPEAEDQCWIQQSHFANVIS